MLLGLYNSASLIKDSSTSVITMFLHAFTFLVVSSASAFLSVALFRKFGRQKAALRYPPGPMPLPIVGNFFDMPRTDLARGFAELSQRYGVFSIF